jgi:hypothetical protein
MMGCSFRFPTCGDSLVSALLIDRCSARANGQQSHYPVTAVKPNTTRSGFTPEAKYD